MVDKVSINSIYLLKNACKSIRTAFKQQGVVQLQEFLTEKAYASLVKVITNVYWKELYKPDKLRCDFAQVPETIFNLFFSSEFRTLMQQLTGKKFKKKPVCVLTRFGKGHYTLLHDKLQHTSGIWFGFELTPKWNVEWGGYSSVITKEQEVSKMLPIKNSLTLVQLSKQTSMFVKYINHAAKRKRVFISGIV